MTNHDRYKQIQHWACLILPACEIEREIEAKKLEEVREKHTIAGIVIQGAVRGWGARHLVLRMHADARAQKR